MWSSKPRAWLMINKPWVVAVVCFFSGITICSACSSYSCYKKLERITKVSDFFLQNVINNGIISCFLPSHLFLSLPAHCLCCHQIFILLKEKISYWWKEKISCKCISYTFYFLSSDTLTSEALMTLEVLSSQS